MIISGQIIGSFSFDQLTEKVVENVQVVIEKNTKLLNQKVKENLDGKVLNKRSGNLYNSIDPGTFTGADGFVFFGQVGTDVTSSKGFPYPAYWEGVIDQGKGKHSPWPRSFEQPALNDIADGFYSDLGQVIQKSAR